MSWLVSLFVGLLTAALGAFVSGTVAVLIVDWYHFSSFEGASSYFVVFIGLVGFVAGFLIGVVTSRIVAARPRAGFLRATGTAFGIVIVLGVATAGVARLRADVPPEIDGQQLFLRVELRWPDGGAPSTELQNEPGVVTLGATSGSVLRVSEDGPLFTGQARVVDGRWVMPGAVLVFTGRGRRLLLFGIGETRLAGFELPLPGRPGDRQRTWSEWLPVRSDPTVNGGFSYRFRVQLASEPFRTEDVGPFGVETRVSGFYRVSGVARFAAKSEFAIRHGDTAVPGLEHVTAVTAIGGAIPALLASASEPERGQVCHLVRERDGQVSDTVIGACAAPSPVSPITSDPATFDAARGAPPLAGWLDSGSLSRPGLFQIGQMVLDTRDLTTSTFTYPNDYSPNVSVPPLALSPDARSFVLLVSAQMTGTPALLVVNRGSDSYAVPIDRARMRFNNDKELGPGWIAHHFTWRTSGGGDGLHLVPRPDFVPLPYHGELTLGKVGDYQSYTLRPGGAGLREAVVRHLVEEMGGERLPDESAGYQQRVRIDGKELHITVGDSPAYVNVSMDESSGDPVVMAEVARQLDRWLADGGQDRLFVADRPAP